VRAFDGAARGGVGDGERDEVHADDGERSTASIQIIIFAVP
jgi:hypothetical protein